MKKWIIKQPDVQAVSEITKKTDLGKLAAAVLVSRGYDCISKISDFLSEEELSSPFLIKDMAEAADYINQAIEDEKSICIYGDYDCDGVTSTVILFSYLSCLGADVCYYIPERDEGYGLNEQAIREIAENGVNLIITVDNGISAIEEAKLIKELGMELIVTDHHQPSEILPDALAVVDPHRNDCTSPYKKLCGAGVVLKLVAAMDGGDYEAAMEQFGDLAAIGTIADIVCLDGENRYIVQNGLRYLANTENCGLSALMEDCRITPDSICSTAVAFRLAPRLNATGRISSPKKAVELLLSEDFEEAAELSKELSSLNNERKNAENMIVEQIYEYISEKPQILNNRVLVFSGEGWHHGVIGIVSAKITKSFGKPCFIISIDGNEARGSARSVDGFSIFNALTSCKQLLDKFGGHTGAGGFSLKADKIADFETALAGYARESFEVMPRMTLTAEKVLEPSDFSVEEITSLNVLEPFGEGNPRPLFAMLGAVVEGIYSLSDGKHSKLKLSYLGIKTDAVIFDMPPQSVPVCVGEKGDFLVVPEVNTYKGNRSVTVRIADCRKSGIVQAKYFNAKDAYEKYMLGEGINEILKPRVIPSREELIKIYTAVGGSGKNTDLLYSEVFSEEINYFKFRIALDIFCELSLMRIDYAKDKVYLVPAQKKMDIESSEILKKLKSL